MNGLRVALVTVVMGLCSSTVFGDGYGRWTYNKEKKRAECRYEYENKGGGTSYNTVIRYQKDDPKAGWDYFANSRGQYWSKCMNKRHPKYNPRTVQWATMEPDGETKEMLPPGECPTPKDGKKPITEDVPDPKDF
jgi:hypothetical protein